MHLGCGSEHGTDVHPPSRLRPSSWLCVAAGATGVQGKQAFLRLGGSGCSARLLQASHAAALQAWAPQAPGSLRPVHSSSEGVEGVASLTGATTDRCSASGGSGQRGTGRWGIHSSPHAPSATCPSRTRTCRWLWPAGDDQQGRKTRVASVIAAG